MPSSTPAACAQGGLRALWVGLRPTLMSAVPMVGIYMPLYDVLRDGLEPRIGGTAPLIASAVARAVAVSCVAPLEVLRTRLMSGATVAQASGRAGASARSCSQHGTACARGGPSQLNWGRGLNATVRSCVARCSLWP